MLPNDPQGPARLPQSKRGAMLSRLARALPAQHGGALVETAVSIPLLFMIFVGIFSFSMVLNQKLQLAEAVSVGGRFLAVDRGDNDPCASAAAKIYAAAPGLSQSKLSLTFTLNGVSTSGASCPGSAGGANANMVSGDNAQISATYPCSFYFFSAFGSKFTTACSLTSTVTELVQ